jgi:hypothetical protein
MTSASDIRSFAQDLRPIVDRGLDDAEIVKGLRDAATDKGIDWSQLKSLVKAQAQDARDDGDRVAKLVERAEFASAYAEMLRANVNGNEETRSSSLSETLAQAKVVSARSTSANMAEHAKVSQALADAGMISQEAADETKQIAAGIARKFGAQAEYPELPPELDRRKSSQATHAR